AVSERRATLTALCRKYGDTVDDVLAWSARAAERLLELDDSDDRVQALRAEQTSLRTELSHQAATLSSLRQRVATALGKAITRELRQLSMPHATVTVAVQQSPDEAGLEVDGRRVRYTASGVDEIEF